MIGFDTNLVVRLLVGDDPVQTKKAEKAFVTHVNGSGVYVSLIVVAEVAWVLAAAYEWPRATIHARLRRLVRTRNVLIEELELVDRALDEYAAGKAELADYLILGKARVAAGELLTFDKKLAREDHVVLL